MANKYHIRSNSFPSASHPSTTRIEEELSNLRTFEATSTSTSESIATSLSFLQDLYICLDDLLNLSSTRKLISQYKDEKCVEEILNGSVRLLDICGITRDTISEIKGNVQALHSALRRRKGDSSIERGVAEYIFFTKKAKKNAKKLITSLKQMDSKFGVSLFLNQDQDIAALIRVLREVITMNMSIFQSILSFLASPSSKSKINKWLMAAKLMQKGVKSCEENSNELQCVDAALSTLLSDATNVEKMQKTRNNLETLENSIESLENGLENIFRFLIKTRTSFLNIMSQ
ncbi:hypothetical protein TanjilG_22884 [Lupinus angustifolius]|uniref:DUF241 domain-containing protein n=1 Tax=Lupinus angustifolius TaxID=3871 RepID=A0A4P1RIE9_LUPAN|nr:PREDICTED: uncharacterized protein LOC109348779 [Lupinus angustifolius]OIW11077.1 hypothetical protein TanjilG_22884 [Lupinus angustifolius]